MRTIVFRILAGLLGVVTGLIAIAGPVVTIVNMVDETNSARQYGGHPSFWGGAGGLLTVFVLSGFFGLIAYMTLRFSFRRAKVD